MLYSFIFMNSIVCILCYAIFSQLQSFLSFIILRYLIFYTFHFWFFIYTAVSRTMVDLNSYQWSSDMYMVFSICSLMSVKNVDDLFHIAEPTEKSFFFQYLRIFHGLRYTQPIYNIYNTYKIYLADVVYFGVVCKLCEKNANLFSFKIIIINFNIEIKNYESFENHNLF